jgi:plastocyanin
MRRLPVIAALSWLPIVGSPTVREVTVDFRTFQVTPDTVTIPGGTTVRWINRDQIEHTVTGGTPDARIAGWDLVLNGAGVIATRTFARAGTYTYFCDRHRFMKGTILVSPTR